MRWLLVDRIEGLPTENTIVGTKLAAMAEDVFEHHFPERAVLPGVMVLEAAAELAAWHEAWAGEWSGWFLLDEVVSGRWMRFALPGDAVRLEGTRTLAEGDRREWTFAASIEGERSALLHVRGRVVPLADLRDPGDAHRHFTALVRHAAGTSR